MSDFISLVSAMSPQTYQSLVEAVASKRWADGQLMTEQQHAQSMQLVMAYQSRVLKSDEPFTIGADGTMVIRSKSELKQQLQHEMTQASTNAPVRHADETIARFAHDDL